MHCAYPVAEQSKIDQAAVDEMTWVQETITSVRNVRGEMNISPAKELPIILEGIDKEALAYLEANRAYLVKFGRFESIEVLAENETAPESATALVGDMRVLIPLGSFIDANAEISRLNKELEKAEKDIAGVSGRLSNRAFTDKAPEAVIAKAQEQLRDAESTKTLLLEQIERMQQFLTA